MKKYLCLILALICCFVIAGCKKDSAAPDNSSSSETVSKTESSAAAAQGLFKKGLWEVKLGDTLGGFYSFTENGKDCTCYIASADCRIPFDYELTDGRYVFHISEPDNIANAIILFTDENHAELTWDTMEKESLTYISDVSLDDYLKSNSNK